MKIVNKVGKRHDAKLREMIDFARPPGISKFVIIFRSARRSHGKASSLFDEEKRVWRPLVTIWLNKKQRYPFENTRLPSERDTGYLPYSAANEDEFLIRIIAHELRHLWQRKHMSGHGWQTDGFKRFVRKDRLTRKFTKAAKERDAENYALKVLEDWRAHKLAERYTLVPQVIT